jgi:cysteine desulfuration protein SufE
LERQWLNIGRIGQTFFGKWRFIRKFATVFSLILNNRDMNTLRQEQEAIIEEFGLFDNQSDIYTYIIELGKKLPAFPEEGYRDENLIKGCQSKVWLVSDHESEQVCYYADSDSTLVKGLIALLLRCCNGRSAQEIATADFFFIDSIGLQQLLTMNRSNGLAAMIKQIKYYALAYQNQVL